MRVKLDSIEVRAQRTIDGMDHMTLTHGRFDHGTGKAAMDKAHVLHDDVPMPSTGKDGLLLKPIKRGKGIGEGYISNVDRHRLLVRSI